MDTAGRIDRFQKQVQKTQVMKDAKDAAAAAKAKK
jgi:hypothetical protein